MHLIIETTARLPYALVPSPDYSQQGLSVILTNWSRYLAGDTGLMRSVIVVRPDEDEARERGCAEEIGMSRTIEYQDIRSILVMAD